MGIFIFDTDQAQINNNREANSFQIWIHYMDIFVAHLKNCVVK